MGAFKKLNQQDAYISTYNARKSWIATGSDYRNLGILNIVGEEGDLPYIPDPSNIVYGGGVGSIQTASFDKRLVYESTKHLYYSNFSSSIIPTTSSYENFLQSSFNTSGSRKLNSKLAIFSLPKEIYGTHIEPNSISIQYESSSITPYVFNNYVTDPTTDPTGTSFLNADNQYTVNTGTAIASGSDTIIDDGEGNLILENISPTIHIGNVIYPHGQIIITDNAIAEVFNNTANAKLEWKSNLPIYTHNYHCRVKANELNFTLNKTAVDQTTGQIKDNISGSAFQPYVSTIGLYNDANELVAVAKTASPVPKTTDTDMSFHIKLDMNFGVDRFKQKTPLIPPVPLPFIVEFTVTAGQTIRLDATGTDAAENTTNSENYNCYVDWGDGDVTDTVIGDGNIVWNSAGLSRHTYTDAGVYQVKVYGQMPVVSFSDQESNNTTLTDVIQWGGNRWENMAGMFKNVTSLTNISATDSPDLSNLSDRILYLSSAGLPRYAGQLDGVFKGCSGLTNLDFFQYWTTSDTWQYVENFSSMFWSIGVTDWSGLQYVDASNFKSMSLFSVLNSMDNTGAAYMSDWDLASLEILGYISFATSVTSMDHTTNWFDNNNGTLSNIDELSNQSTITDFTGLAGWDVSGVTSARSSLKDIPSLNISTSIMNWDLSSLQNASNMFHGTTFVDQSSFDGMDFSNVTDASFMFEDTSLSAVENPGIGSIIFNSVTDFEKIFFQAGMSTIDISGWQLGPNVTSLDNLFNVESGADTTVTSIDVTGLDVSGVTAVGKAFYNMDNATITGLNTWTLSSLTDYFEMFENMKAFTGSGIENWDMSNATSISEMLYDCDSFDTDISGWDISGITTMSDFMTNATGMSTANYDALLIGWEATLQTAYPGGIGYPGIDSVNFGGSTYTTGGAAETARTSLINTFSWSISDGGPV